MWRELLSFGWIRWHSLLTQWHFRGFLPTVQGWAIKNILLNVKFLTGFFCFSTHGSFLLLAPSVKRCKIFSCMVYKIGFSLDAETQSFMSFCWSNYINLNLHCSFPFSAVPEFTKLSTNQNYRRYFQLVCSNSAILEKRQSNYFSNQTAIHKGKTSL